MALVYRVPRNNGYIARSASIICAFPHADSSFAHLPHRPVGIIRASMKLCGAEASLSVQPPVFSDRAPGRTWAWAADLGFWLPVQLL